MDSATPTPQRALDSNDARMHALLEAAVDAVIGIDERGIIQLVNPAAEGLFGYTAQEMVGLNVSMLMPSPYREEHDGYIARYVATGQKRIIGIGREVVGLRKDGTTFPLDLSVAEARLGDWRAFVGILRDLTEHKRTEKALRESEERFRLLVEGVQDYGIFMTDAAGNVASWNSGAEHIFGYAAKEVLGRHVSCLYPPEDAAKPDQELKQAGLGNHVHTEGWRVRKDGSRFWTEMVVGPLRDDERRVRGFVRITRDVTERRRAELELRRNHEEQKRLVDELQAKNEEIRSATQQLWHAAKLASVGELAASIAHELNNPLATISLRIESLLASMPAGDNRRRALEIVEQETKRMANLVANLLQFSRRGVEEITTVDIQSELNKAVELVQHVLRKRQIDVVQELNPNTPTIFADRQKLRQVFLNLVSNASDAMPRGGTLTLRAAPTILDNGDPGVMLDFSDTGDGIPADLLGRIMEPFFTTKEEGKGTGLGLAICRRVVEEHRGAIQISSSVGAGTTVRLMLPLRNVANVASIQDRERK
jgi:PAS domain S-box-containing protein